MIDASSRSRSPWEPNEPFSLLSVVNILLARRGVLVAVPVGFALVMFAITYALPKRYTAVVALAPESASQNAGGALAGLASRFGLPVGAQGGGGGAQFYGQVLHTNAVLSKVLTASYDVVRTGSAGSRVSSLFEYFQVIGTSAEDSLHRGIKMVRGMSTVQADPVTGIVTLRVTTNQPALSLQVARQFMAAIEQFDTEVRRTAARARREFLERRLAVVQDSLETARGAVEAFLRANRTWQNSPRLVLERDRLNTELALKSQVYQSLATQYEAAQIDEVNDTPLLTLVDPPLLPTTPSFPRKWFLTLLAGVLGAVFAITLTALLEYRRYLIVTENETYQRTRTLWRETWRGRAGARA